MKKLIYTLTMLTVFSSAIAQDTLDIMECFRQAEINHPLYRLKELNAGMNSYAVSNLSKSWLPEISFNGQTTYQSDVVGFGIFTAPHDQYKLYFEINQQLYDGGVTKTRKEIEASNLNISQQQVEIEFHKIKQQVTSVYFSLAMLKKNIELLNIARSELNERIKIIQAAIENGALLPENEYVLRAEMLKIEIQKEELYHKTIAATEALNKLTGLETSSQSEFSVPYDIQLKDSVSMRPEMALFAFQKDLIENKIELLKTANRPKLFVFAQTGYGKPGLNMLSDQLDYYYIAGLGLKWNILDWGKNHNKIRTGQLQKESVDLNINHFNRNISIALQNELADISYYKSALAKDKELIDLRNKIKENAYARLQSGSITATDYLTETNAELLVCLQFETHRILLAQSIIKYQLIKGDF